MQLTEIRKRRALVILLALASAMTLSAGVVGRAREDPHPRALPLTWGAVAVQAFSWAVILGFSWMFAYLALRTARFRIDAAGVHEWHWRGPRLLRWSEVTRAYLERKSGGGFIVLCRGTETWKLPAAAFDAPGQVFDFVDAHLPASASRRADA